MGFFDRLKKMLGGGEAAAAEEAAPENPGKTRGEARKKRSRPPLGAPPPPSENIEDVLVARAAGEKRRAREILKTIDRGAGLRTVLRAAAALEDNDDEEVRALAPKVIGDAPWRLFVQTAAALGDVRGEPLVIRAAETGAPPYAIAWARCAIGSEAECRRALVELLFIDAPLARTVAARDLKIEGAHEDGTAIARYASLDAGRDAIARFGADSVVALVDRIAPKTTEREAR